MSDYQGNQSNGDGRGRRHNQYRSTQGFRGQNAYEFNRGREGDDQWRRLDVEQNENRQNVSADLNYGEQYGQAAYGRATYDPSQNRGWESNDRFDQESWSENQPFSNREQDYRGGRWSNSTHSYEPRAAESRGSGEGRYNNASARSEYGQQQIGISGAGEDRRSSTMRGSYETGEQSYQRGIPSGMEQMGGSTSATHLATNTQGSFTGFARDWGSGERSMSGYGTMAQYGRGEFSGKGPKNYQRNDERIEDDVCECLTEHGSIDASDIDVKVQNGEVTLSGTVSDRRMKRMAEDAIESIRGVKDVINQIRVSSQNSTPSTTASNAGTAAHSNGRSHGSTNGTSTNGSSAAGAGSGAEDSRSDTNRKAKAAIS